jgi:hypothetical protein
VDIHVLGLQVRESPLPDALAAGVIDSEDVCKNGSTMFLKNNNMRNWYTGNLQTYSELCGTLLMEYHIESK